MKVSFNIKKITFFFSTKDVNFLENFLDFSYCLKGDQIFLFFTCFCRYFHTILRLSPKNFWEPQIPSFRIRNNLMAHKLFLAYFGHILYHFFSPLHGVLSHFRGYRGNAYQKWTKFIKSFFSEKRRHLCPILLTRPSE